MPRCKTLTDLHKLGLTLDPANPSKAIPVSRNTPPGTSLVALSKAGNAKPPLLPPNASATVQPNDDPGRQHWLATAKTQWAEIRKSEKYLTRKRWEFAGTLELLKSSFGDDIKAWTAAYREIGIDRRRVSELLLYRQVFKTAEAAEKCSLPKANQLIRRAGRQIGKPEGYDHFEDCFETPQWLYDVLNAEFGFGLDAAATKECHKCEVYLTPDQDALKQNWIAASGGKPIFLNAPFERRELPKFVEKAYDESQKGAEVVCVLPYYKSYPWFRDYVWAYAEVRQIQGMVVFDGFGRKKSKHAGNIAGSQSFDTIVAIFRPGQKGFSGPYIDRPGKAPVRPQILDRLSAPALPFPEVGERKGGKNFKQPYEHAPKRVDYYTPAYAVEILLPYLPKGAVIWEAAWGSGVLAGHLNKGGYPVVGSPEMDMLTEQPGHWDILVTNPAFSMKTAALQRAYDLGKPFALLLPIEALAGKKRIGLYRQRGIQLLIPDKRINFHNAGMDGNGAAATFPTAWYCWGLNLPKELNFVEATW